MVGGDRLGSEHYTDSSPAYPLFSGPTMVSVAVVLLGWIVDLVFEIYMVSNGDRSPLANGIGVYIAMGVFVHILQIVLEAMAEGE